MAFAFSASLEGELYLLHYVDYKEVIKIGSDASGGDLEPTF